MKIVTVNAQMESVNTEARNTDTQNTETQNIEAQNTEVQNAEAEDIEAQDTETQNTEETEIGKSIQVDLRTISSIEMFHDLMELSLEIKDAYGRNLDALYEVLADSTEDIEMEFIKNSQENETEEEEHLHRYFEILKQLLADAEEENPHLHVIWKEIAENV